jgi:hypothetical protein
MSTGEMCGLQTGPGEYCDDERMAFERRCAFHTLAEARTRLRQVAAELAVLRRFAVAHLDALSADPVYQWTNEDVERTTMDLSRQLGR